MLVQIQRYLNRNTFVIELDNWQPEKNPEINTIYTFQQTVLERFLAFSAERGNWLLFLWLFNVTLMQYNHGWSLVIMMITMTIMVGH